MVALLGICGSLRKASLNRALLNAVRDALPADADMTIHESIELPIFNSDLDDPPGVVRLKAAIAAADGLIISVPEYNYSVPGGLKNALDWVSRPPECSPLRRKPVGIVGAATGMSGTIRAQTHLRQMMLYSDSPCLSQTEVLIAHANKRFDADGRLTDESTRVLLKQFGAAMIAFVRRCHG